MEHLRMLLSLGAPVNLEWDFECDSWDEHFAEENFTLSPLKIASFSRLMRILFLMYVMSVIRQTTLLWLRSITLPILV